MSAESESRGSPSGMRDWGWVGDEELARVLLVSPHPDDGVLSCGQFLAAHAGVEVVTVFAGVPPRYPDPPAWWDALCGFAPGDDVVTMRRAEDRAALGALGATVRWLDFVEEHFAPDQPPPPTGAVADALEAVVDDVDPTLVLFPMGLANPEHVLTHDAAMAVRARRGVRMGPDQKAEPGWIAYEDIAYDQIPGQLAWRVTKLFKAGDWPTPVAMPRDPSPARKRAALALYGSQVRGLEADWGLWARLDAPTPEQYWRIAAPPPGWEAMIDLV